MKSNKTYWLIVQKAFQYFIYIFGAFILLNKIFLSVTEQTYLTGYILGGVMAVYGIVKHLKKKEE